MKKVLAVITTLLLFVFCDLAQAQVVVAQVSSKQVQAGVPFEYAIVINTNPNSYSPPNFNGLSVVSGPNQSSSMQWVNGQTSTQLTLSWGLVAQKEGKYTIGPAMVVAGSQRYETQPVTIEVIKGTPSPSGGQNEPQHSNRIDGSDLFIRTAATKNKCYLGEQITITQKVYSRLQIIGFQKFAQPAYDGFYSQAQESSNKGVPQQENIDGVIYFTYEIFRTIATANQAGKINLTPIEGEVIVRKQTNAKPRNIFEQFFGAASYEDIPVKAKSRPFTVEVLPLPEEGKPESFNGAVGNFTSKVEVTRRELKANDAFNLKMTIGGKGNLKLVNPPALKLPEGFETYEPKVSENANSKTFDYLVIPRQEGDYELNSINFSYFNLDTKKYVTIPSGDIRIKVLPPDPNSQGAQVFTPHSQVKETENDIRYIKKGDFPLVKTESEFFNSGIHFLLLFLPLAGLGGGLILRRNHIKNNSNQVLVRERKAVKIARKQLVNAEKMAAQNKKDEFYTEILRALNNYLSFKLNIPVADLSREVIAKTLTGRQVEDVLQNKLLATIETGEYAKYAPGAVSGDLQAVYRDTVDLITGLEQKLNRKV
jgi:hypothetical protein